MASEEDLIAAIRDTLESDGSLNKFKAEMRSKVMKVLESQEEIAKPKLSKEIYIMNELIREYLQWNKYKYTKAMLIQETGLDSISLPRKTLLSELGVQDTEESTKIPILLGLVESFKNEAQN